MNTGVSVNVETTIKETAAAIGNLLYSFPFLLLRCYNIAFTTQSFVLLCNSFGILIFSNSCFILLTKDQPL